MHKIDLKKSLGKLYQTSAKEVFQIDVPEFRYLMVDGQGNPNTSTEYAQAVAALFSVSYTAKLMMKTGAQAVDYAVMPLEGLWWAEDMSSFEARDYENWRWTMMIMQPDFVGDDVIQAAMVEAVKKRDLPAIGQLRMENLAEGRCVQILHIGPLSEEGPVIKRLHDFIDAQTGRRGKHHEIHLSDIRRVAQAKWKTIIRQPML